jgi:signal transduction histidine kinase
MQLAVCDHTRESGGTGVSPVTGSPSVSVDPDALEQVLFNLVDNACKYARDAENKRIEVDVRQDAGSGLSVTVRDHGPGISPEHQRAIFRAFDRGAHGPGDTVPGVGLGLALARGLARDMGGDLSLERCPDALGGACFRLTIPGRSGA